MPLKTYRFKILDAEGNDTGDTMRSMGSNETEARIRASNDPGLKPSETIGECIGEI